jgi:hypothetical protein
MKHEPINRLVQENKNEMVSRSARAGSVLNIGVPLKAKG